MQIEQIQHLLTDEIDHLSYLRDQLTQDGEPLSINDKLAIRRVLAGTWLTQIHQEARLFFTDGSEKDFCQSFETTLNALQQLI